MSDEADRAAEVSELVLSKQLQHREPELKAIGVCYYCAEPVPGQLKFCDSGCRDDYDHEQKMRRLNGG